MIKRRDFLKEGLLLTAAAGMAVADNTKVRNLDYSKIRSEVLERGAELDVKVQKYRIHG